MSGSRFPATLALVSLVSAILAATTPSYALKPMRGYPAIPSDYGIRYEAVRFTTSDSVGIAAWFFPAQDTAGIAHDLVGRMVPVPPELRVGTRETSAPPAGAGLAALPTVVVASGDGGNMTQNILYAYHLCTQGLNVLTFDWRGFGESDEWPKDGTMLADQLCYTEFLHDYEAALAYAAARSDVDPARIGLFGYSTGAYLSFAIVSRHPEVAAFAGRALITSFGDLLPLVRSLMPERSFSAPADWPDSLDPIRAAERVRCPVLLIVGEKDPRTPPWMSERVAATLAGAKEIWIVPGAEHGGATAPEFTNYPEFFVRVREFFRISLKVE